MADPRIKLKNRHLAALLAFLIPGAGHAYQGRYFKALIYSVSVLGLFVWGMSLGDWKVIYFRWQPKEKTIGYLSQVLTGLPALPALVQSYRYSLATDEGNRRPGQEDFPIDATFRGFAKHESANDTWEGPVSGRIKLSLQDGQFGPEVRGEFHGVLESGDRREVEMSLAGPTELAPRLLASGNVASQLDGKNRGKEFSSSGRRVSCRIVEPRNDFDSPAGQLEGTIPRSFLDWYQVPLEDDALQELNRRLGRRFEIALLFTWVAGLLNLLAVWDALEGPAYGYGDEVDQPELDGQPGKKLDSVGASVTSATAVAGSAGVPA